MTLLIHLFTFFVFGPEIWLEKLLSVAVRNADAKVSDAYSNTKIRCRIFNFKKLEFYINLVAWFRELY